MEFSEKRAWVLLRIFLFGFVIVAARGAWLQLLPSTTRKLSRLAKMQYGDHVTLTPYRGGIYDRNMSPLALSLTSPSIAMNPKVFANTTQNLFDLGRALNMPINSVKKLAQKKKSYFVWLKRKTTPEIASKIRKLNLDGIIILDEPSRFYPEQLFSSQLVGATSLDGRGLFGLENKMNGTLAGTTQNFLLFKDGKGQPIYNTPEKVLLEQSGNNLVLTLDVIIQEITEAALKKSFETSLAKSAFAIVSDPHTGQILALANLPSFNPNSLKTESIENTRNHALNSFFEPGSIIKPLLISEAIDQGVTSVDEIHNCEKNGKLEIDAEHSIHDDHPVEFATTAEVLIRSSNICAYKIAKKMGKDHVYKTLKKFGLARGTNFLQAPGRQHGFITPADTWNAIRFANIAFGQGFLATGIEMVQAYSAIANGGYLVKPYIIDHLESSQGEVLDSFQQTKARVLSFQTSKKMRQILTRIVLEGTGTKAHSEFFTLGGKTGTTQKVDPETKRYSKDARVASFIGVAPSDDPHLVIMVVVDEPRIKPYYGGTWAAPVFKEIAEKSLQHLGVLPNQATSLSKR